MPTEDLCAAFPLHPQALLPVALQLSSLYQSPLLLLPTHTLRPALHPWAHLMAALVVAGAQRKAGIVSALP